ncbi:Hypothetical protein A7982_07138 [Minicystis rosea]|nr:Hypothetical protein A7982_07138 [Minicystis rosea]
MKIQRVTFLGIAGLADTTVDFTNPATSAPHDLVVLTGAPGCGTTRMLEAIVAAKEAIAPYGPMATNPGSWVGVSTGAAKVAFAFYLDEEERRFAGTDAIVVEAEAMFMAGRTQSEADDGIRAVLNRYTHGGQMGKMEYFPSARRIPRLGPFGGLTQLEQRLLRSSKDAEKYGFIPRFLQVLEREPEVARAFAERLAALSPTCRYERDGAQAPVPRCFTSRGRAPLRYNEISDAEADAVIFAATAVAIDLSCSLVLVDRPELYVHPSFVRSFVAGFAGLGEDNQFILASASPEVIAAAESGCVIRLEGP